MHPQETPMIIWYQSTCVKLLSQSAGGVPNGFEGSYLKIYPCVEEDFLSLCS